MTINVSQGWTDYKRAALTVAIPDRCFQSEYIGLVYRSVWRLGGCQCSITLLVSPSLQTTVEVSFSSAATLMLANLSTCPSAFRFWSQLSSHVPLLTHPHHRYASVPSRPLPVSVCLHPFASPELTVDGVAPPAGTVGSQAARIRNGVRINPEHLVWTSRVTVWRHLSACVFTSSVVMVTWFSDRCLRQTRVFVTLSRL